MKVGSLVECINCKFDLLQNKINNGVILKPNTTYTIRDIYDFNGVTLIRLEEVINPISPFSGKEGGYWITRFKELQPPIANIEEHIKENALERVLK